MAYSKEKARKRGFKHLRLRLKIHKLNGETDKVRKCENKLEHITREHPELHK